MRREFSTKTKLEAFTRSRGRCEACSAKLFAGNVEYDHALPCGLNGANDCSNIFVLCRACHRLKSAADVGRIARAKRQQRNHIAPKVSLNPLPGGKRSRQSKKLNGKVVPRQSQAEKHRETMAARDLREWS